MKFCCEICYEEYPLSEGITCSNRHFLCSHDLNAYLTENLFPHLHKLRKNSCLISCPALQCLSHYSTAILYDKMGANEQARYRSIIESMRESAIVIDETIPESMKSLALSMGLMDRLKGTFQDILTLVCPTCRSPVDPFPDACSAVMCLNCGNYYCNYCFKGFATGNPEENRASSHIHTALHHTADDPTKRDAFLPVEVVKIGQLEKQKSQLVQCVSLAMSSKEFVESRQIISLALILLDREIKDLGSTVSEIWLLAEEKLLHVGSNQESKSETEIKHSEDHTDPSVPENAAPAPNTNAGSAQLANALLSHNLIAVRQILQAFRDTMDVNYIEPNHCYPLISLAIFAKQKDIAQVLIRRGADPTLYCVKNGRSPLFIAIESGYLDILVAIFEKYPTLDPNMVITTEGNGYTMLHTAVRYNHGHIIQYLLSRPNINVNCIELEFQYTPIMMAIVLNLHWAIDVLLNFPGREDASAVDITIPARNGRTPLYVAVEKSQLSTFQTLLKRKSTISLNLSTSPSEYLNEPICLTHGSTPLHVAIIFKKREMVDLLLFSGVQIDVMDKHGATPLMTALIAGESELCLHLLESGANPIRSTSAGRSYFYVAIEKNLVDVVRYLLTHFHLPVNEPSSQENIDCLPLSVAVIYKSYAVIELLIEHAADPNLPEKCNGNTPFINAVCLENYWAVSYLSSHGANLFSLTRSQRSSLYIAVEKGNIELIQLLLNEGAKERERPGEKPFLNRVVDFHSRRTPLHVAVFWKKFDAVALLLSLGADELAEDNQGKTPLDMATEMNEENSILSIFQYYRQRRRQQESST